MEKQMKNKKSEKINRKTLNKFNKKAQHEIIGFVIIVVIVMVAGLFFLSFSLRRNKTSIQSSAEISNLIEASMYYTTECAIDYLPKYDNFQDLIKSCYNQEICLDGRNSCAVLNKTLERILDQSLNIGPNSKNKAYKTSLIYKYPEEQNIPNEEILYFEKGEFQNCSLVLGGDYMIYIISNGITSGDISFELEVCSG